MSLQLAFNFDSVPVSCPVQERYHAIAPVLSGHVSSFERAKQLNVSYSTVTRWLARFREDGMPGLSSAQFQREPYTPEVVVSLLFYKSCLPGASYRELARVVNQTHKVNLHHETVKTLLERYFFWRHDEFRRLVRYPIPSAPEEKRLEMVKLAKQGWSETSIAKLLVTTRKTVRKWIRRSRQKATDSQPNLTGRNDWLFDLSRAPLNPPRKVYFSAIHACLQIQKKYPAAGWFRAQGYLSRDYQIELGQTTIKKVMKLNRRLHLVPPKPVKFMVEKQEEREGPMRSARPFEHAFIDIRYLDAKPEQTQLYSCMLLEGFSRTVLAGSLSRRQDLGTVLRLYYLALLQWGRWETVVSDHGSQFTAGAFALTNKRLGIRHHLNDRGHPWQNLIESQFGIQARLGEYSWSRCQTVERAVEIHRELIRDHNRLPHFAHREREDKKHAPLEVLAARRGADATARDLHYAFSRKNWQRRTDARGFVRVGKWRVYVEEGLPKTPVQILFWDGKLRAEYKEKVLSEYAGRYSEERRGVVRLEPGEHFETEYNTKQQELFEVGWQRDPVANTNEKLIIRRELADALQLRLKFETAA